MAFGSISALALGLFVTTGTYAHAQIATLATTSITTASVASIWDTTMGQVNTLVLFVLPYIVPAMLLLGVLFAIWHKAKSYVGGI